MKSLVKAIFWSLNILALIQAAYIGLGHREVYRNIIFFVVITMDLLVLFLNQKWDRDARRRKKLLDDLINTEKTTYSNGGG